MRKIVIALALSVSFLSIAAIAGQTRYEDIKQGYNEDKEPAQTLGLVSYYGGDGADQSYDGECYKPEQPNSEIKLNIRFHYEAHEHKDSVVVDGSPLGFNGPLEGNYSGSKPAISNWLYNNKSPAAYIAVRAHAGGSGRYDLIDARVGVVGLSSYSPAGIGDTVIYCYLTKATK